MAALDVERKVEDVDGTGRLEDGGRKPKDGPVGLDDRHRVPMLLQSLVCAEEVRKTQP